MKKIKLNKGQVALIDDSDYEKVSKYKWYACWNSQHRFLIPQACIKIDGKFRSVPLARFIMDASKDVCVDHANHDTLDNRRSNLRIATY